MGEMMTERRLEQLEKVAPEMVYGIRYSDFGELCIEVNRARESERRLANLLLGLLSDSEIDIHVSFRDEIKQALAAAGGSND